MSSALGIRGACSSSSDFLQATTQVSGKGTLVSYTQSYVQLLLYNVQRAAVFACALKALSSWTSMHRCQKKSGYSIIGAKAYCGCFA